MYTLERSTIFKKDQKRIRKRRYHEHKLSHVVEMLAKGEALPTRFRNHKLVGNYTECWECHIEPDWLLIYFYDGAVLRLIRTGTHADLFD